MRKVLIVTPYFAPQSHAAVYRAHKLARYLPQYGWEPLILTTDTNYSHLEDPRLRDELPDDLRIYRARYIAPSLQGLRHHLLGQDRTFMAVKRKGIQSSPAVQDTRGESDQTSLVQSAYRYLQSHWLSDPDNFWTWRRPAVRLGKKLLSEQDIEIVYTTCMPLTSHQIGLSLKRALGIKWVADFRDPPPSYLERLGTPSSRVLVHRREIEKDILSGADAISVLSISQGLIMQDMYASHIRSDIHFIPTGADLTGRTPHRASALREQLASQGPYLVFCGEFLLDYDDTFFEIYANAIDGLSAENRAKIVFIGNLAINKPRLDPILTRLGLQDQSIFLDHMPQPDLYEVIDGAIAGILLSGYHSHWWNSHAKMTDFIALRKPVVATVPNPSESRMALSKCGLGVFLDPPESTAVTQLQTFLKSDSNATTIRESECARYEVAAQIESFAALFDRLTT